MDLNSILLGDCRELLPQLLEDQARQGGFSPLFDSCITDPPYELGFMGQHWDSTGIAYDVDMWRLVLRALKPGAHLLAFGGTRTHHRMVCAIEDAGFEIRDEMQWLYGSGFPKSHDISKAIDKQSPPVNGGIKGGSDWQGWGTALKPACEPICLARKPLSEKTVAANVLTHGCGGLNIDASRIETDERWEKNKTTTARIGEAERRNPETSYGLKVCENESHSSGRWPANVLLDEAAAALLDEQSGELTSGQRKRYDRSDGGVISNLNSLRIALPCEGSVGGASRFFYVAKASPAERDNFISSDEKENGGCLNGRHDGSLDGPIPRRKNLHPTVKPIDLMRYLCRLITPPVHGGMQGGPPIAVHGGMQGGPPSVILDPFTGSGSTCIAAYLEGFHFLGFEKDPKWHRTALARLASAQSQQRIL